MAAKLEVIFMKECQGMTSTALWKWNKVIFRHNRCDGVDRCDGVVVRAPASQSVDLGFIPLVESYQKTLKNGIRSFPAWILKDTAYSSSVLFRATLVTCFLPVVCLSLSCFFVFVLFDWKQVDFHANSLISNKSFAFCTVASA